MADRPLISIAEQFTGLPMRDLIGAPLMAAAEANSAMAFTQTRFLIDTAFRRVTVGDITTYEPILITLSISRTVVSPPPDGAAPTDAGAITSETTKFDLPLLTILPLNSLGVDEVDITFHMEVKSSFSETTDEMSEQEFGAGGTFAAKAGYGPFSAEVTGSVSYNSSSSQSRGTHYEKSNSAEYDVHVHAGQLQLPPGVTTIIQAYTNAITPVPAS